MDATARQQTVEKLAVLIREALRDSAEVSHVDLSGPLEDVGLDGRFNLLEVARRVLDAVAPASQ
jgi:hypothetical protein